MGATSNTMHVQVPCGGNSYVCNAGNRTKVPKGFYAHKGGTQTRHGYERCEIPNLYCHDGIKFSVLPGFVINDNRFQWRFAIFSGPI